MYGQNELGDKVIVRAEREWFSGDFFQVPDDCLFDRIIQRHEELWVFSDPADKVSDKDEKAVSGGGLDSSWDPTVVRLNVGLQEKTILSEKWPTYFYKIVI